MFKEFNWRLNLLGLITCILGAVATPYVVLKLGMSTDLSYGGMFLAAAVLGKRTTAKQLAIQLNIIQTMINAVTGVGFMCVILAAFYYIQHEFKHDIGFNPAWWQIAVWLWVSANLGVFMGAIPRRMLLDDKNLPWPSGQAVLSVAETLTDPNAGEVNRRRRTVLMMSTAVAALITFLKDGLGVITAMVGNAALKMTLGWEMAGIGLGMLIPLSVGLSGLIGVWLINQFGDHVSMLVALTGTTSEHWSQCKEFTTGLASLSGDAKAEAVTFLTTNCGDAMKWVESPSHFPQMVKWMMWPATAMMIAAALTSVLVPLVRDWLKKVNTHGTVQKAETRSDEHIPISWIVGGITFCVIALIVLQSTWFAMPWQQVLFAVALQPVLIIAGARVLGITGSGPVSLMANATQFLFGLVWPNHIQQNLNAAHISADPQSSSESTIVSFWVARRLGGKFTTLVLAQLFMLPIGALLLAPVFNMLVHQYGIGSGEGQLSAPTGLKIASLAMVMEKGLDALPCGALTASIVAMIIGVVLELLLFMRVRDSEGKERQRFSWLPIPSAIGFALILPPSLTIALAIGSVISAVWRRFAPAEGGSYETYGAPLASGLVAGEALIGAILLPILGTVMELVKPLLK